MKYLLALTLLLAPTYVVKINLFGLPANLFMVWIFVLWAIFIINLAYRNQWLEYIRFKLQMDWRLKLFISAFLLAGTISLFVGGLSIAKLGQYLVLIIQPVSLFMVGRFIIHKDEIAGTLLKNTFYLFLAVSGLYAILQYLTLIGVPMDWWGNSNEPKRAVSFFIHPNFYSLFITPLLAYLIPDVIVLLPRPLGEGSGVRVLRPIAWLIGATGLLLSLSRGGWLGLAAAAIAFVVIKANKKLLITALISAAVLSLIVLSVPTFRYRVLLPFHGEKSSVARFSLWHTGWAMIQDAPVLGKGLSGFNLNWDKYNTDPGLDHYNFPHNIILNFWVDTGLLGALSIITLLIYGIITGIKNRTNTYQLGLALALIAITTHGLIDIPYLKNDLAVVFWLLWALSI